MSVEPALVDTNILVYATMSDSPHHAAASALMEQAQSADANLFVASQSLVEFYSVVTNRRRVTLPLSADRAIEAIECMLQLAGLVLLPYPQDVVTRWCELLRQKPVVGAEVFDVQLVATMLAHGIRRLYTLNVADFRQFSILEVLVPTA
jgi:uncharacterized protein